MDLRSRQRSIVLLATLPLTAAWGLGSAGCAFNLKGTTPASSSTAQIAAAPRPQPEPSALTKLFDDYYDETLALDPVLATTLGEHRYDAHLANDLSEDYRARVGDFCRRFLARLQAVQATLAAPLSTEDQLNVDLVHRELSDRLEGLAFPDHLLALTHISGQPVDFPVMASGGGVHPFDTVTDYENFLGRITDFVTWMDTAIANLQRGIEVGVVHPAIAIEKLIPQLDAQLVDDPKKSIFLQALRTPKKPLPAADSARLQIAYERALSEQILPAYRRLRTFLANTYLPHCRNTFGVESLPNGANWYAYRVRTSTTTQMSPEEIFRLGESEVARIEKEMFRLRDRAGWLGDLPSFAASLSKAPGGRTTREGLVDDYQALRKKVWDALPALFGRMPRAPFEIRAIETFREDSAPSQYQQASPDGSRPGVFYVNAAEAGKGHPMRVSETLFLHEALPGHHFQISLQYEDTALPRFRRLLGYTAFVEGWALYAESLGDSLGVFRDPTQALDHLGAEMLRAVRLVVDTGLHHRGWSRDQAIAYFRQHVVSTTEDIAADAIREVDRYIVWPGQALAYKVGQLKFAQLRERAAHRLGPQFDIRKFHDEVLRNGPLPLNVLEARQDAWIAGTLK